MQNQLPDDDPGEITRLLNNASGGRDAIDLIFPIVYQELKLIAHRLLARGRASTVTSTVLVHELYSKLNGGRHLTVEGKQHFFSLCTRAMKQIIMDHARSKAADKRLQPGAMVGLSNLEAIDLDSPEGILAVEVALRKLETNDHRLAQIMEFRVFGGLELEQIAEIYEVSLRQIQREWMRAKIWLTDSLV